MIVRPPVPWQRTLFVVALMQGVMSTSSSLAWPFLPLYVLELGIHPATQASLWAGIIQAPQFLLAAIMSPLWGSLADRVGRKAMVLRCSASMAVFTLAMGLVHDVWQLLAVTICYGVFSGMVGAANALVAVSVPEERLGYALGWLATAQLTGTLVGPLLGGLLADALHDYRRVYFVTAAGAFVAILLAFFFVREQHEAPAPHSDPAQRSQRAFLRNLLSMPQLAPIFVILVLAQLAASALSPVVALYVRSLIGPGSPWIATIAGAAIAVTGVAGLLSAPLLGRRSDRLGYRTTLLFSLLGTALFTIPQAFAHSIWIFVLLRSGVGVFLAGIAPSANAWVGRLTPRDQRGRVFGVTASASSLGLFFGPLLGGIVAARFGIPAVFVVVGSLMLVSFVWALLRTRADEPGVA